MFRELISVDLVISVPSVRLNFTFQYPDIQSAIPNYAVHPSRKSLWYLTNYRPNWPPRGTIENTPNQKNKRAKIEPLEPQVKEVIGR
jgi:hypothetical protein